MRRSKLLFFSMHRNRVFFFVFLFLFFFFFFFWSAIEFWRPSERPQSTTAIPISHHHNGALFFSLFSFSTYNRLRSTAPSHGSSRPLSCPPPAPPTPTLHVRSLDMLFYACSRWTKKKESCDGPSSPVEFCLCVSGFMMDHRCQLVCAVVSSDWWHEKKNLVPMNPRCRPTLYVSANKKKFKIK